MCKNLLLIPIITLLISSKIFAQSFKPIRLFANDTIVSLISGLGELSIGTNLPSTLQGAGSFNYGNKRFFLLIDVSPSIIPDIDRIDDITGRKLIPLLNNHDFDFVIGKKLEGTYGQYYNWFKNAFLKFGFTRFEANSVTNNNNESISHFHVAIGLMTGMPIKQSDSKNAGFFLSGNLYYTSFQLPSNSIMNTLFNETNSSLLKKDYLGVNFRGSFQFGQIGIFADFNYNFKRRDEIPSFSGKSYFTFGINTIINKDFSS